MLRIVAYQNDLPAEYAASIFRLFQKQMKSIGTPKSLAYIERAAANMFQERSQTVVFIGYENENVPVAFAFGNIGVGLQSGGDYFWLNELYVDVDCRRNGYATVLLAYVENWLKEKGIRYMACVTGSQNTAAQRLYQKNGFETEALVWVEKNL